MPFACIFVPDFPVEALLRVESNLRPQPLAVLDGKPPLQKVFAANENARRAGVTPGMTKLQIEACSGLAFRARSTLQEAAAHAALLDCAQSFSPRVEDTALDTIVLDLLGMELLFGSMPKIAHDLARRTLDFGLVTNVAVATNPDTAVIAARGFRGVTVIPEGGESERLGNLPVELLLVEEPESEVLWETFQRWGIRNLRDLATLPDVALSERLGQHGIYLQKLARGGISRAMVSAAPPLQFEEAIELEHPLTLLEPLAFLLSQLLEQLCARLAARALATQELRLELELANGYQEEESVMDAPGRPGRAQARQRFQRTLRLPLPLLDSKTFLKLLQLDLQAHPPGAPIVKIQLAAEPVRPRPGQYGLFLPPSPEPEKLELTLARIAAIVGEDKVGSLQILDTHRPQGFRMQRFALIEKSKPLSHGSTRIHTDRRNRKSITKTSAVSESGLIAAEGYLSSEFDSDSSGGLVTALRIFRPPAAVIVTLHEGRPTFISCLKRKETRGEILWAAGPWRSSGDWWEKEGWARDEWDIAVQEENSIGLYRLVRDLLAGRWLLEGTYD